MVRAARRSRSSVGAEEDLGVADGEGSGGDGLADGVGEVEEAQGVGDGGAGLADALGDLFLGEAGFVGEGAVGEGFFDGVEVGALEVLDEGHLAHFEVGGGADEGGYFLESGLLGGA